MEHKPRNQSSRPRRTDVPGRAERRCIAPEPGQISYRRGRRRSSVAPFVVVTVLVVALAVAVPVGISWARGRDARTCADRTAHKRGTGRDGVRVGIGQDARASGGSPSAADHPR